jgi:hypothetical protein
VVKGSALRKSFLVSSWLVLIALTLGEMPNANCEPKIASDGRKVKMITVLPDSPSLVLQSTHILLIRIEFSEGGQWAQDPSGNLARQTRLGIRLEQILKGETEQQAGSQIRIEVRQFGRPGTRYYALPGVWSDQPIQPGARLVAFSSSAGKDAATLLVEPSCKKLFPAESSLSDVRLALDAEHKKLSLSDSLRLSEPSAASLGHIFPEYIAAKNSGSLFNEMNQYGALLRFMENPKLTPVARTTLLDFVATEVSEARPSSQPIVQRFVVTLFNLIAEPEASALHDNIITVYIPDILKFGSDRKLKASDVFRGVPGERARAENIISNYHGAAPTDALKDWIKQ